MLHGSVALRIPTSAGHRGWGGLKAARRRSSPVHASLSKSSLSSPLPVEVSTEVNSVWPVKHGIYGLAKHEFADWRSRSTDEQSTSSREISKVDDSREISSGVGVEGKSAKIEVWFFLFTL